MRRSCPCTPIRTISACQDPGKLEGNTVFTYLDAFCQPEHFAEFLPDYQSLDELKAHYQRGGLGDVKVKKFLNNVMQSLLSPMRERRAQWEGRLPEVYEILKKGSEIAAEHRAGYARSSPSRDEDRLFHR